jgi:hypothetical protein
MTFLDMSFDKIYHALFLVENGGLICAEQPRQHKREVRQQL